MNIVINTACFLPASTAILLMSWFVATGQDPLGGSFNRWFCLWVLSFVGLSVHVYNKVVNRG